MAITTRTILDEEVSRARVAVLLQHFFRLGACLSIRWISLACEGRIRFCLGA